MKTLDLSILSRLGWLTRLKFGMAACLSAKPLGKQKKWQKSKESSITNTNGEKWEQNMSKGERGDFKIINLDLKTPLCIPSFIKQGKPSHSPEMIRKALFMHLLDSGRHEMSLTSGYIVFK